MPTYRVACLGVGPAVVLCDRLEAMTPATAAQEATRRHLPRRRVHHNPARYAQVNGVFYFVAYDQHDPDNQLIITVKEATP